MNAIVPIQQHLNSLLASVNNVTADRAKIEEALFLMAEHQSSLQIPQLQLPMLARVVAEWMYAGDQNMRQMGTTVFERYSALQAYIAAAMEWLTEVTVS